MNVTVNYRFKPHNAYPFHAELEVLLPSLDDEELHFYFIPYINRKIIKQEHTTVNDVKYRKINDNLCAESWKELEELVNDYVQKLRQYKEWLRNTSNSIPNQKTYLIE